MAPPKSLSAPLTVLRRADRQLLIIALCLLLVVGYRRLGLSRTPHQPGAHVLGQTTIAVGAGGTIVEVVAPEDLVPGTRVLAGLPESGRLAQEQLGWLAAGTVPQVDGVEPTMITAALLDLHVLSLEHGVPVAGQSPAWHYVWPRDSALVAVAFARTGHAADAERVLTFLERVQPESGVFAARYRPDGSGVPDARGVQVDGTGWALWAMAELTAELPAADRIGFLQRHRQLLDRSAAGRPRGGRQQAFTAAGVRGLLGGARAPSHPVDGRSDPGRAGGRRPAVPVLGDAEAAQPILEAEQRLSGAIRSGFGRDGYPRRLGAAATASIWGRRSCCHPSAQPTPDVIAAWRRGAVLMRRPAGGLAPGAPGVATG